MARKDARNVNPSLSSDPHDKLLAALNRFYGKLKHSDRTTGHRCISPPAWNGTSGCRRTTASWFLMLADVVASAHKGAAESMAASLPPAPRCPL